MEVYYIVAIVTNLLFSVVLGSCSSHLWKLWSVLSTIFTLVHSPFVLTSSLFLGSDSEPLPLLIAQCGGALPQDTLIAPDVLHFSLCYMSLFRVTYLYAAFKLVLTFFLS